MDEGKLNTVPEASPLKQAEQELAVRDLMVMLHDLVYILGTVALVFIFFFRLVTVEGDSMYPTLCNQDRIIMLTRVWYTEPAPGDIVVARAPAFSADPLIKRVIAVEGDTVDIDSKTGDILVNGAVLPGQEQTEAARMDLGPDAISFPLQVGEGCVFLLGDNRDVSYDSRFCLIGQVDERNILGKVVFLGFPGPDHRSGQREFHRVGWIGQEADS